MRDGAGLSRGTLVVWACLGEVIGVVVVVIVVVVVVVVIVDESNDNTCKMRASMMYHLSST